MYSAIFLVTATLYLTTSNLVSENTASTIKKISYMSNENTIKAIDILKNDGFDLDDGISYASWGDFDNDGNVEGVVSDLNYINIFIFEKVEEEYSYFS